MRDAGYTALELMAVGFKVPALVECGYSIVDLKKAGFSAHELMVRLPFLMIALFEQCLIYLLFIYIIRIASYDNNLQVSGFTLQQLKDEAGYKAIDLKRCGCTLAQLKELGYKPSDLKVIYSLLIVCCVFSQN
jgi:hypothetical protein